MNTKELTGYEFGVRLIAAFGLITMIMLLIVYMNGNVKFQAEPDPEYCLLNSKYSIESDGRWFKIKKADGTYKHDAMAITNSKWNVNYNIEDIVRIRQIEAEITVNEISAARSKDAVTYVYHNKQIKKLSKELDGLKKKKIKPQEEIDIEIAKLKAEHPQYWDSLDDAIFAANKHIEIKGEVEYGTFNKVCCD